MNKNLGFTIIELMVTVAILGILMASSVPLYRTWQQRAYGSEAAIMLKQILEAEIIYFLENDEFYPSIDDGSLNVFHENAPDSENVIAIADKLNISITTGHFLDYSLSSYLNEDNKLLFQVEISSLAHQFEIFKNADHIIGILDEEGNKDFIIPY